MSASKGESGVSINAAVGIGNRLRIMTLGSLALVVSGLAFVFASTVIELLRHYRDRWNFARKFIGRFARLVGVRLCIDPSVATIPANNALLISNHGSFIDALVLLASLPHPVCFVAASEFSTKPILGRLLRNMGVEFVHRDEPSKAASDIRRLVGRLKSGDPLVIFPEGSLSPIPGLREFHVGAFFAAARANVPIYPVAIRGSSEVLRPHSRLPHPGRVSVFAGVPIWPPGSKRHELEEAIRQTRHQMIALSGMRDLTAVETGLPEDR